MNETLITVCGIDEYCYPPFFFFGSFVFALLMNIDIRVWVGDWLRARVGYLIIH